MLRLDGYLGELSRGSDWKVTGVCECGFRARGRKAELQEDVVVGS